MGELIDVPTCEEQREILIKLFNKSVVAGEKWFLIDYKWMKSLKEFLKIGHYERHEVAHPGAIDNRPLIDNEKKTLRTALVDKRDYELVCEEAWNLMSEWYGVVEDTEPICRKAIPIPNESLPMVEVYPINLNCILNYEMKNVIKAQFSRIDKLPQVVEFLRREFKVPQNVDVRLWVKGVKNVLLSDFKDKPLSAICINEKEYLVLDTEVENGKSFESQKRTQDRSIAKVASRNYSGDFRAKTRRAIASSHDVLPGLCGLMNLGNTCFMNSVIQCMSNVPLLTEYFLSGKHLTELNIINPLGMKGEIAKSFGELITKMWSGDYSETPPSDFKTQVGYFNPSFSGFQQHDSQELLTFLLDGLHEDLNRIKQKPYIEINNQSGKDEKIAAIEAWENYKKRNDSIIVDTFHGLLRSTVICPECERASVTFDPFCYLSLPLPCNKKRPLRITFVPFDGSKREIKYCLMLNKKDTIKQLCQGVAIETKTLPNQMVVAEITQSHFHKFYGYEDTITDIEERDTIKVFELPITPSCNKDVMIIPVCFWELCKPTDKYMQNHLFGSPFLITVPKEPITYEKLNKLLLEKMQRHFEFPVPGQSFEKSSSALNMGSPSPSFNIASGSTDSTIENKLDKLCAVSNATKEDSAFRIFYMDAVSNTDPVELPFNDNTLNLSDVLFGSNMTPKSYRKVLILQFTTEQRNKFFHEKPAAHDHLIDYPKEKDKISINDCLSLFTTCEKLSAGDTWYCPTCRKHKMATKKFDLWKLPKVLIVHLKRFSYTRYSRDKIDVLVDFPITNLCMDKYVINSEKPSKVYDLIGVCNHYGHMGGGHYTAFCKNKDSGKWYIFNDSSVSSLEPDQILTNNAYLLIYIARDCINPHDNLDSN